MKNGVENMYIVLKNINILRWLCMLVVYFKIDENLKELMIYCIVELLVVCY